MSDKHGCWVAVQIHKGDECLFAKGVRPVAQIEFPPKKAAGTTVIRRYQLEKFGCVGLFRGPVRVPDEAGLGKAKVTFSFEAWREGAAKPSMTELSVVNTEER